MSHNLQLARRVLRFEIRVDDTEQTIPDGQVLKVAPWRQATRSPAGRIEVWVEATTPHTFPAEGPIGPQRRVQVFGTGHVLPEDAVWLGSCLDGPLVWHLYDVGTEGGAA